MLWVIRRHMTYKIPAVKYHHSDPKYKDSLSEGGKLEASLNSKQYKSGRKYNGHLDGHKMYESSFKLFDLRTTLAKSCHAIFLEGFTAQIVVQSRALALVRVLKLHTLTVPRCPKTY